MGAIAAIRSAVFYLAFALWTGAVGIVFSPILLAPRKKIWFVARTWSRGTGLLLRVIVGLKVKLVGFEHVPEGRCIVACKHQSVLETVVLVSLFEDPTYILKESLLRLPVFGLWLRKFAQIPIKREKGRDAMQSIIRHGRVAMDEGRQILIFPEGTRKPVGAPPAYKFGVAKLYDGLNVPVVPAALDAGFFWTPRRFAIRSGTTTIAFMPPIAPGLALPAFMEQLEQTIETRTDALVAAAG